MSLKHDKVNARHRGPLLCARSFVHGTETMSQISRLHLYLGTTHHGDFAKSKGRQSSDSFVWQSTCVYSYSRTMMTHVDKSIAGRLIYTVDKFTMTGIAQRVFGAGEKFMRIWIYICFMSINKKRKIDDAECKWEIFMHLGMVVQGHWNVTSYGNTSLHQINSSQPHN